ncbi:MAG: mercury methylation corrinoid protein HgcA [Candidatus Cloacimonetes bacterium]|nr:mercury methylation corrinoid protein HgcA [Candidatus Cloacimonadota bacterium]
MENNTDCCCACDSACCGASVSVASTALSKKDIFGGWKVRWGIDRYSYSIRPGLYSAGEPKEESPVLVSANYKLTFDVLRKKLAGLNCWLLILDTKGINVWCAAGKGTFGTEELIFRLKETGLSEVVSHRSLILPQLGAVGVNANVIKQETGFSVIYGPVRAADIKAFISAGYQATPEMRKVRFSMYDRLVLTPMEIVPALKKSIFIFGVLFILNLFLTNPFDIVDIALYLGAVLTGGFITPILLPFIPGRAFSFKGGLLGMILAFGTVCLMDFGLLELVGYLLILPSISSYLAMNFTGSSTYTSRSGVLKEMKIALPFIIFGIVVGCVMIFVSHI